MNPTGTARSDGGTGGGSGGGGAVAAIAAQGERTLVLHGAGPAGRTAARMLPKLPEVCFVEVGAGTAARGDVDEALRQAVEHGLRQLILLATADALAALEPVDGLAGITADMGGSAELADAVAAAGSARRAYELWEEARLLGPCGRELCRRVADDLERAAAAVREGSEASPIAVQVVLMDFGGERMVGMYGRLSR
ncbi:hypothetical protein [Actinomadura rugatobispora]|uniref:Uncharacterized protein n=1 Tax=Actinomadura rugatobispora TaxID=1994 RepID=A0ABW0ZUK6_9ACTN|nr:hypothetical protein GCM10010200_016670 [Actinomadura rugatobispora]